ncbi:MAG TPA: two-component regulator propeller domain-containing protein, partial [Verrucomicrobiota bacterium]|nr:two-component regulator propeller domain-containing protein [Verrucomicrobiota bacterium]
MKRKIKRNLCWHLVKANRLFILLIILLSIFTGEFISNCESKQNFIIDVFQTENGLPQNSVISMMQSRNGYLWVGTLNGLARFDGLRFTVFDENNTIGLTDSRVVSLFEDNSSNVWISTESEGVFLAIPDKIIKVHVGGSNRFSRVVSICQDDEGAVWHYTADGQLARYKDKRVDIWNYEYGFPSNVRLIIPGENGGIIVATDRRLSVIGPIKNVDSKELPFLRSQPFRKLDFILKSKKGGYWVLADGKIRRYKESKIEE